VSRQRIEQLKNVQKHRARAALSAAIESGRLVRQPCVTCGQLGGVEAHHTDYARPLDVVWLCHEHHKMAHKALKHPVPEISC
jgi:hypothetical protein